METRRRVSKLSRIKEMAQVMEQQFMLFQWLIADLEKECTCSTGITTIDITEPTKELAPKVKQLPKSTNKYISYVPCKR